MRTHETATGPALPPSSGNFAPTRWTRVLRARGETAEAKSALGELCEDYWQPIFIFLRSQGRDEDTARELTQEFFARLLAGDGLKFAQPERGRFRSFLLGAVKHFLADVGNHAQAAKRGGGCARVPLDTGTSETTAVPIADPAGTPPDSHFDREWAITLVNRALEALAAEQRSEGRQEVFEVLKPWLLGELAGQTQAAAGQRLGWTENAVRVAVHRLRKRFRDLVRAEIIQTVDDPAQVQDELRYLLEVLSQ